MTGGVNRIPAGVNRRKAVKLAAVCEFFMPNLADINLKAGAQDPQGRYIWALQTLPRVTRGRVGKGLMVGIQRGEEQAKSRNSTASVIWSGREASRHMLFCILCALHIMPEDLGH